MQIVFRVDSSTDLGTGHVVRCAALARELQLRGAQIRFLCRDLPGNHAAWLSQTFHVDLLPAIPALSGSAADQGGVASLSAAWRQDVQHTQAVLGCPSAVDWVVVDHYAIDRKWHAAMRCFASGILVIDDLADRAHDCDILLDQNLMLEPELRYQALADCAADRRLFGPRYALLRPQFSKAGRSTRRSDGIIKRIVVSMGGSDPRGATLVVLDVLKRVAHERALQIDVVVGSSNPRQSELRDLVADVPSVTCYEDVQNMADFMHDADLVIGAGGSSNWERSCLGIASIVFAVAKNQVEPVEALLQAGCVLGDSCFPTHGQVEKWLRFALDRPEMVQLVAHQASLLVDGRGASRVADHILPGTYSFRYAREQDILPIWHWRNSADVRAVSADATEIDLQAHISWFRKVTTERNCKLLVAETWQKPAAVVRFDIVDQTAELSVYKVPGRRSPNGLISAAIRWIVCEVPEIKTVIARVLPGNVCSREAFERAGFALDKDQMLLDMDNGYKM